MQNSFEHLPYVKASQVIGLAGQAPSFASKASISQDFCRHVHSSSFIYHLLLVSRVGHTLIEMHESKRQARNSRSVSQVFHVVEKYSLNHFGPCSTSSSVESEGHNFSFQFHLDLLQPFGNSSACKSQ